MRFTPLPVEGAFAIEPEPLTDQRGWFARVWCAAEFERHGIGHRPVQANVGWNPRGGTLRGLHYQAAPALEAKLVRCTRGRVWDVVVDLRPESGTFRQWHGEELSADNHRMIYIPPLCAHGYLTLEDQTELWYQASADFDASLARGVRYDDPALAIRWPAPVQVVSERDRGWPLLGQSP